VEYINMLEQEEDYKECWRAAVYKHLMIRAEEEVQNSQSSSICEHEPELTGRWEEWSM
jgi:hypothetical protein